MAEQPEKQRLWERFLADDLITLAREILPPDLPPEFWEHLSRGLQELARASALYARHARTRDKQDELTRAYEDLMDGEPRVGVPPESS